MSISEEHSENNNNTNSNVNNGGEPKNPPDQVSGMVEPSTEVASKIFLF